MGKKNNKKIDPLSTPTLRGWEGVRMLRDMSRKKFNLDKDGPLFRDVVFVRDTINECQKQYNIAFYHYQSMVACYGNSEDPLIQSIIRKDGEAINAYSLCISQLSNILRFRDTGYLLVLINNLPRYRL